MFEWDGVTLKINYNRQKYCALTPILSMSQLKDHSLKVTLSD